MTFYSRNEKQDTPRLFHSVECVSHTPCWDIPHVVEHYRMENREKNRRRLQPSLYLFLSIFFFPFLVPHSQTHTHARPNHLRVRHYPTPKKSAETEILGKIPASPNPDGCEIL